MSRDELCHRPGATDAGPDYDCVPGRERWESNTMSRQGSQHASWHKQHVLHSSSQRTAGCTDEY